jgi:hypothetical protein
VVRPLKGTFSDNGKVTLVLSNTMDWKSAPQQLALLAFSACLATVCQILFFKTDSNTVIDALATHQWLFVIYTFVGAVCTEHFFRCIRNRRTNGVTISRLIWAGVISVLLASVYCICRLEISAIGTGAATTRFSELIHNGQFGKISDICMHDGVNGTARLSDGTALNIVINNEWRQKLLNQCAGHGIPIVADHHDTDTLTRPIAESAAVLLATFFGVIILSARARSPLIKLGCGKPHSVDASDNPAGPA